MASSLEWARQTRLELLDEIRTLTARAREGSRSAEALGLLPEQDHLQDLKRRLSQVDRLIEAEAEPGVETGWPAHLGDPSAADEVKKHEVRRPS